MTPPSENTIENKLGIIKDILEIELKMFLTVPTEGDCRCRENLQGFQSHRRAQFLPWSTRTLKSYLHDLIAADQAGINLMTRKYARMQNLIPCENQSPLISQIIEIQIRWQQQLKSRFPNLMGAARPISSSEDSLHQTSFETYLRGELETYSENTLQYLHADMHAKLNLGISMSEEVYCFLVKDLGYDSLETAEATIGDK